MEYTSTRNSALRAGAAEAIVQGLAPDGGLFVPKEFPQIDYRTLAGKPYPEAAAQIVGAFLPEYDADFLRAAAGQAYASFEGRAGALHPVEPGFFALELWHGPTSAFKDYALQLMPKLLVEGKRLLGRTETTKILVATSGDTGKAALAGYAGLPGIKIAVFYPDHGTSEVQRLQMATQAGDNVAVFAVRGNFDDAQTGVKRAFGSKELADALAARGERLSSANSINWGRLVPQIVYYFFAYNQLVGSGAVRDGEAVDFCVPTGNFGDILAGYYAKRMGLPVGKLICASNRNDVLAQFLRTGVYDARRPFYKTASPSMDILVSSNLERLLYHVTQNAAQVAAWMEDLAREGRYQVPAPVLEKIQETFGCGSAADEEAAGELRRVFEATGYLMDPHTAVAWRVARLARPQHPCVVLSTADPYKFPASVLTALGQTPDADEFAAMRRLEALTHTHAPAALAGLRRQPVRFSEVIAPDEIETAALSF